MKREVNNSHISRNSAFKIFLNILYQFRTNKIKSTTQLFKTRKDLINAYKSHRNNLKDEKYDIILNQRDRVFNYYKKEIEIIERYLSQTTNKEIKLRVNPIGKSAIKSIKKDKKSSKRLDSINKKSVESNESKDEEENRPLMTDKQKLKAIKNELSYLSRDDLAYILNIDPALNFEKEKTLRNRIANTLFERNYKFSELEGTSLDQIKEKYQSALTRIEEERLSKDELKEVKITKNNTEKSKKLKEDVKITKNNEEEPIKPKKDVKKSKIQEKPKPIKTNIKEKPKPTKNIIDEVESQKTPDKKIRPQDELDINDPDYIKKLTELVRTGQYQYREPDKIKENKENQKPKENNIKAQIKEIESHNSEIEEIFKRKGDIDSETINKLVESTKPIKEKIDKGIIKATDDKNKKTVSKFKEYSNHITEINEIKAKINDLNDSQEKINELALLRVKIPDHYISNQNRKNLIEENRKYYNKIKEVEKIPKNIKQLLYPNKTFSNFIEVYEDLLNYNGLDDGKRNIIQKLNKQFLKNEIKENREFFNINGIQLDDDQIKAILIDEDEVEVIAGAGTGKTLTIQGKVKYLVEKKGVDPDTILGLSFSNTSAKDLYRKINNSLNQPKKVNACTFHEFARQILRKLDPEFEEKSKNDYIVRDIIEDYLSNIRKDNQVLGKIVEFFGYYYLNDFQNIKRKEIEDEMNKYKSDMDLRTFKAKYGSDHEKKTMQGERVRSLEELLIANFLYMHDIEYEYERPFDFYFKDILSNFINSPCFHQISLEKYGIDKYKLLKELIEFEEEWIETTYKPDFYIKEKNLILEHYGIDRNFNVPMFRNNKDEEKDYQQKIYDKRAFHKKYHSNYIETYSYYRTEGTLLENLERLLREREVTIGERDYEEIYQKIKDNKAVEDFKRFTELLERFINNFEANNHTKNSFREFRAKNNRENGSNLYTKKRQELFLDIVETIYDKYIDYIENSATEITSNQEIIQAKAIAEKYDKEIKYIIIDEFQDISRLRYDLIEIIKRKNNAKLFVVGDDWQSIYGFGGSDIKLFSNFKEMYPNAETTKITLTRRNSKKLNEIVNNLMNNKKVGMKKELKSNKKSDDAEYEKDAPIQIYRYNDEVDKVLQLEGIIKDIIKNNEEEDDLEITLLSRVNKDIFPLVNNHIFSKDKNNDKVVYKKRKDINIKFSSIHKSKGLETSEVIILNFKDEMQGFPSQIIDDDVLDFVKISDEGIFDEERRLLYVALTRTMNNNYLLAPSYGPSIFIKDLKKDKNVSQEDRFDIDSKDKDLLIQHKTSIINRFKTIGEGNRHYRETITTNVKCPNCGNGYVQLVINHTRGTKYIRCSNRCIDDYTGEIWSGGSFYGETDDLQYIIPCPRKECNGILVKRSDGWLGCSNYFNEDENGNRRCCQRANLDGSLWAYRDCNKYNNH